LAGVRSVIALAAGVGNVSSKKMTIYTSISIVLWNGIILLLAFKVQQNWKQILQALQIYNKVVLAAVILIAIIWLLRMFRRKSVNG
jgi:membrane protein DedA with SNARE-associated domain